MLEEINARMGRHLEQLDEADLEDDESVFKSIEFPTMSPESTIMNAPMTTASMIAEARAASAATAALQQSNTGISIRGVNMDESVSRSNGRSILNLTFAARSAVADDASFVDFLDRIAESDETAVGNNQKRSTDESNAGTELLKYVAAINQDNLPPPDSPHLMKSPQNDPWSQAQTERQSHISNKGFSQGATPKSIRHAQGSSRTFLSPHASHIENKPQ